MRGIDAEFGRDGSSTSMADEFESCAPRRLQERVRWAWAECRAQQVAGNHTAGHRMVDDEQVKNTDIDVYIDFRGHFLGAKMRLARACDAHYCTIAPRDVIQRPIGRGLRRGGNKSNSRVTSHS